MINRLLLLTIIVLLILNLTRTTIAQELIPDFTDKSVPVLNEEIRQIKAELKDHESRLVAGGL